MNASSIRIAFLFTAAVACNVDLVAQRDARGWGVFRFDTSLQEVTDFVEVAVAPAATVARRSGGEVVGWGAGAGASRVPLTLPLPATRIAVGQHQGLAILTDGTIAIWGNDLGSYNNFNVPALPAGVVYTDVASGFLTSCALRSDGGVVAWGDPVSANNVPALPTGMIYVDVTSGDDHHVALRSDGEIVCWGRSTLGRLNVPALPPGVTYTAIDAGGATSIALRSDGAAVAWGYNFNGQTNVPALPPGLSYTSVGIGQLSALALRSDGQILVWGNTAAGQNLVPSLPVGLTYVAVHGGYSHCAALRSDGSIVCWGANSGFDCNQLGPPTGIDFAAIDAGEDRVLALFADGTTATEGSGPGQALPPAPSGLHYVRIAHGHRRSAAIRSDGEIVTASGSAAPALPPGTVYVDVDTGGSGYIAARSDGEVVEWGGWTSPGLPPPPAGVHYVEVRANYSRAALRSDGEVVATLHANGNHLVPALPPGLTYVEIAPGTYHSVARRSDGKLVTWGSYGGGPPAPAPALPPGVTYVEIATGEVHSVARRSDGTIVTWYYVVSTSPNATGLEVDEDVGIPGMSYTRVGAGEHQTVAVFGPETTYVTFGNGCAGTLPATRLVPEDTPKIGEDFTLRLFDLPTNTAFLIAGFSNTTSNFGPLPLSTAAFGMPGCTAYVSDDFVSFLGGTGGIAESTLTIPNDAALVGVTFFHQALVLDPPANAAGFVLSDAARAVIGK